MCNSDRESRKDYFSLYIKGIRGAERCRAVMREMECISVNSFILPKNCKENMAYLKELEADKKELEERMQTYENMCSRVADTIKCLEGVEKEVISLRYMEGLTWEEIAKKMVYSVGNVHRIHNKAIDRVVLH